MPNEGRLKIGSSFLKIGSNYLRIGPVGPRELHLLACQSGEDNFTLQYLLKLSGGSWSLVASANLLDLVTGTFDPPTGGFARQLGSSLWASVSGLALGDTINALRSDDNGATWAEKIDYEPTADWPHGLPVTRDANGNLWAARREAADIFVLVKSTDNGQNWTTSHTMSSDEDSVYHVAAHPTNGNVIAFAGLQQDGGSSPTVIWVTTNGGSSWSRVELNPSAGPLTDSVALLFTDDGTLLYTTFDLDGVTEVLRVYSASSPYSSFSETDLITANVTLDAGPFLALSSNPQFLGANWPAGATQHGRVWRRTTGAWTELAEPFAAGISLFGLCYNGTTLYAMGADSSSNALKVAKAENAGSGSISWSDITADVNTAAGTTLAVLAAQMLFEVAT